MGAIASFIKIFFVYITILCPLLTFSYSSEENFCREEITEYFSKPVNQEAAKEYIRLKGEIAFHRTAHALFIDDSRGETDGSTTLKQAIAKVINKLDRKTKSNLLFRKAREAFESYPLSRKNFAEILPYISEVLNQNQKLKPSERYLYQIDQSDIKLFHLLATVEKGPSDDSSTKQHSNKKHSLSVLNFPRRINALLKNKNSRIFGSESLHRKIKKSLQRLNDFLANLNISGDCRISCNINVGNPLSNEAFLDLAQNYLRHQAKEKLKWGDIWISIGKSRYHEHKNEKEIKTNSPTLNSGKNQLEYLASKILKRYSYFFSKQDLLNDPGLTRSLAYAIDTNNKLYVCQVTVVSI